MDNDIKTWLFDILNSINEINFIIGQSGLF